MIQQLQDKFNVVKTARERPRVALGQLLYLLIVLGLFGVILWYIVKQAQHYQESQQNPYTSISFQPQKEILYPVINLCTYYSDNDPFTVEYSQLGANFDPSIRYYQTTGGFQCAALNEDQKAKAKGTGYKNALGEFLIPGISQAYIFYLDEKKVHRSKKEENDLPLFSVQFLPTGAYSYIVLSKIKTIDLDEEERIYFNYTIDIVEAYTSQTPEADLGTPDTTIFTLRFAVLHEEIHTEKAVATVLDVIGNIFGFISLLFLSFAWVHLLIMGPFIAGVGFRSVWTPPLAK
jgi:hypothetical protein